MRRVICRRLVIEPDPGNWSERPDVWYEAKSLMSTCEWFRVFDIAEDLYQAIDVAARPGPVDSEVWTGLRAARQVLEDDVATKFEVEVNEVLASEGIAWLMKDGVVVRFGLEGTSSLVGTSTEVLQGVGLATAAEAISGALAALSDRPIPDTIGAVHKSMAALESALRTYSSDEKPTLGELLKKYKDEFPAPLGTVLEKTWGFASEHGRHLQEGGVAEFEEAELVVGLAASASTYLGRKLDKRRAMPSPSR